MERTTKILIFLTLLLILITPVVSFGQTDPPPLNSLVPCDNSAAYPCEFSQLMDMVNRVIKFILFDMVVPIAAIMFAYAGFSMITAGEESSGARTKAKNIFMNTALGLVIAVAAWLIIRTLLSILGYDGDWIGFVL